MRRAHDRGGWSTEEPVDQTQHPTRDWERRFEALSAILSAKRIIRIDEGRRAAESIEPEKYESMGYYDRRMEALETLMVEKGILTEEEIDQAVAKLDQAWSQ